ncbi:hypothetical protein [Streptomyces reniochalinae]|uniref:Serine/threonine protein kinase n=1 Tax=Streptomyces reniochalinae TaxID=2250578 RepID=A0A367EG94_9ACTN|nr:hypothetical protein [Streptomyces reniochalinae]RCG17094.1 hypothetical protein DQ392_18775 [Streptomyces reniochalinae]
MAERSTAAVDVAETSGGNGKPLTARQDGATSDGATDATNGHSRDAVASPLTGTSAAAPAPGPESSDTTPPGRPTQGAASPKQGDTTEEDAGRAQEVASSGGATPDDAEAHPTTGPPAEPARGAAGGAPGAPADDTAEGPAGAPSDAESSAADAGDETPAEDPGPGTDTEAAEAAASGAATDSGAAAASGTEAGSGTDTGPETEATAGGETGPETETGADPRAAADTGSGTDTGPEAEAGAEAEAGTDTGSGSGTGPEAGTSADAGPETGPETETGPEAGAADGAETGPEAGAAAVHGAAEGSAETRGPDLHSGHKLARRYRLEECVTRLDGFSSWRAVDEKLRRAVGVHALPAGHSRARQVLAAARSAALLGDPRFVQVLDAVEEDGLVYVVHEWLPDAVPLSELLSSGPLEAYEAYQLVGQLAQGLSAAHREGLAHLRLNPTCVLRTGMGQYRVRGLAVNAALRGVTSDHPQRDDTEAIGALLYAALTQRWPYEDDAHGLPGVGSLDLSTLVAPEQVRAGVHRGLSTLAMRALVNDGATASRQEQPCATPEELAKAVSTLPRIRPPEQSFTPPPPYQRTTYQQGAYAAPGAVGTAAARVPPHRPGAEPPAPPALPGRTGKALKWGVSALLIAALGLGSWQVADALLEGEPPPKKPTKQVQAHDTSAQTGKPVKIEDVKDFDPQGDGSENPEKAPNAIDGKPETSWVTSHYIGRPDFGNLKSGAGLVLDLGKVRQVSRLKVDFAGKTSASFLAAPSSVSTMPSSLGSFSKVSSGSGEHLTLKAKKPIKTRYVLVWLTKLPLSDDGNYRGRVTEVQVLS